MNEDPGSRWPIVEPSSLSELVGALVCPTNQPVAIAFRGHSRTFPTLIPSAYRPDDDSRPKLLPEKHEAFIKAVSRYVSTEENRLLTERAFGLSRPEPVTVAAQTLLQHYGFATDLLDWTDDGLVASFFAVVSDENEPGEVWWFSQLALESAQEAQWKRLHVSPPIDVNALLRSDRTKYWFSKVHHPSLFARANSQRGFFTVGNPADMPHNEQIDRLERDAEFKVVRGRIVIKPQLKHVLLATLRARGVDATSLRLPWADDEVAKLRANCVAQCTR